MVICVPEVVIIYRSAHSEKFGDNWLMLTFFSTAKLLLRRQTAKSFSSMKNKTQSYHELLMNKV